MGGDLGETSGGGRELEGPEEVVGLGEVGANGEDLVDEVLNADDALAAKSVLNHAVGGDGDALLVNLAEPTLVDEVLDALEAGVAVLAHERENKENENQ